MSLKDVKRLAPVCAGWEQMAFFRKKILPLRVVCELHSRALSAAAAA